MGREGFYSLPIITMKKTETMVKMDATPTKRPSPSKIKSLATGLLFALAGLLGSGEALAQKSDSLTTEPIDSLPKTELNNYDEERLMEQIHQDIWRLNELLLSIQQKSNWWTFFVDPTYSPNDKLMVTRFQWWGSVHGVDAWGFLDLTGTLDINSAFGKFTVSKWITKWVSVGVEYTLNSETPDKVRSWVILKHKLANGKVVYKLYPIGDKWFEPFILVWVDQKLWEKAFASAFCGTDIKSKGYYGEAEVTYKITKQIDALFQTRVDGTYSTKPKTWVYVWARVKFK